MEIPRAASGFAARGIDASGEIGYRAFTVSRIQGWMQHW
jgi:hypothetical protein